MWTHVDPGGLRVSQWDTNLTSAQVQLIEDTACTLDSGEMEVSSSFEKQFGMALAGAARRLRYF